MEVTESRENDDKGIIKLLSASWRTQMCVEDINLVIWLQRSEIQEGGDTHYHSKGPVMRKGEKAAFPQEPRVTGCRYTKHLRTLPRHTNKTQKPDNTRRQTPARCVREDLSNHSEVERCISCDCILLRSSQTLGDHNRAVIHMAGYSIAEATPREWFTPYLDV